MWMHSEQYSRPLRWHKPTRGQTDMSGLHQNGVVPDGRGNVFEIFFGNVKNNDDPSYDALRRVQGQNLIIKRDSTGRAIRSVRVPRAATQVPNPGEISYGTSFGKADYTKLDTWIGSAKGCVFAVDYKPDINYVWDEDGLWVGSMFEDVSEEMKNFKWGAAKRYAAAENFGGTIYTVPRDEGILKKGDVLYIAAGDMCSPVYRITGFDDFTKHTIRLTVRDGEIVEQVLESTDAQGAPRASLQSNLPNLSVFGGGRIISYTLPRRTQVTLELFSLQGRKAVTLAAGPASAGTHHVRLDASASRLSAGMYIVRMKTPEASLAKKVRLVR